MEATQHRGRVRVRVRRRSRRPVWIAAAFAGAATLATVGVLLLHSAWRQGQGLAHVDGAEITDLDVRAEARARKVSASISGPALLDAVVARSLIVSEARRRGLDKRPNYPSDRRRAVDEALAAAFLATLPPPAPPAQAVIDAHIAQRPEAFSQRRRFILEGLSFAAAADPVSSGLSWEDLQSKLQSARIPHRHDAYVYTSADAPAQLRRALSSTSVGALISVTGGGQVDVYRVLSIDPAPLEGGAAVIEARHELERASRDAQIAALLNALKRSHSVQRSHTG